MCAMSHPTPLSKLPNFDPRQVPVTGVDAHLPAVPVDALTPRALRQRFQTPPPWQPELRQEPRFTDRAPAAAAVLVPLVDRPQGLSVLLTERADHLSTHSGQVAFPGGKVDPADAQAAAMLAGFAALSTEDAHARVAAAFGQLKIAGELDTDVLQQAQLALACQQWLNTVARSQHPDWEYADQESERLALMKAALESASAL